MTTVQRWQRRGRVRLAALLAVGGLLLAACGGASAAGTSAGQRSAASRTADPMTNMPMPTSADANSTQPASAPTPDGPAVTITNFAFQPATLTVKVGTSVTWTNRDEEPHTVVGNGLKSPVLGNAGSTYSYTFTTAGSYSYNCSIHPFMHGTVVVTA